MRSQLISAGLGAVLLAATAATAQTPTPAQPAGGGICVKLQTLSALSDFLFIGTAREWSPDSRDALSIFDKQRSELYTSYLGQPLTADLSNDCKLNILLRASPRGEAQAQLSELSITYACYSKKYAGFARELRAQYQSTHIEMRNCLRNNWRETSKGDEHVEFQRAGATITLRVYNAILLHGGQSQIVVEIKRSFNLTRQ